MSEDIICDILASWATQFVPEIHVLIVRYSKALKSTVRQSIGEIITALRVAMEYLRSLPLDWVEPDLKKLCRDILLQIAKMCLWPADLQYQEESVVADCNFALGRLWANDKRRIEKSIYKYFSDSKNDNDIYVLKQNCMTLLKALQPFSDGETNGSPTNQHDHAEHCKVIYHILQKHCLCDPLAHKTANDLLWHPTRLYLGGGDSNRINFDILVSAIEMTHWQDFRLSIPSSKEIIGRRDLPHGPFCILLENPTHTCIAFELHENQFLYQSPQPLYREILPAAGDGMCMRYILQNYRLTPRDRILLSYAIAKTYWQFYNSDLMRIRWSNESIWFMSPEEDNPSGRMPLQAFVALPFGVEDEPPADLEEDIRVPLNHRCPRVFALGILLLEVGLAKPFPTKPVSNPVGQANFDHRIATNMLKTLREDMLEEMRREGWGNFSNIDCFVNAVEFCLKGENFIQDSGDINTTRPIIRSDQQRQADLAKRRKQLHDKVIEPLARLSLKGYRSDSGKTIYIDKKQASGSALDDPGPVTKQPRTDGAFLSHLSTDFGSWLDGLKGISARVYDARMKTQNPDPIRVAILDTGLNPEMPFYKDVDGGKERLATIIGWKDYVETSNTSIKKDSFGHGSLMGRLVTEICPFAEILIARVAKDTKHLPQCQENIVQAIRWAREQGADIISMSFGLPRNYDRISWEISPSHRQDKQSLIFLASAGNSPNEDEAFPARLPSVISIYATKRNGGFLGSNAQRPSNNSAILGTFGDSVPFEIQNEFDQEYRGICKSGSSIACAVAAGISAIMLAYVPLLPGLVGGNNQEDKPVLDEIRRTDGMAAIFRLMAQDKYDGRWFVTPARFWQERNADKARYSAIYSELWKVHRKNAKPSNKAYVKI